MLSQQDKQNILGWAYYWLRGQAEQTTKAAYCDVEAACCDDVAKVWFLIKVIGRAEGFLSDSQIELLYQRLQCLIGLNTVTACPANCFPCTPVDPPVPPPIPTQQCTVIVGDGCCRYSAQNCKLNNYEAWVCLTLPEELVPVGEVGRLTITIFNITKIFSAITQPLSRLVIIQELINLAEDIGYGWYTTADGICIYQAENFDDALPIAFTTYVNGEPSGSFTQGISSVVSFCGNFYKGEIVTENAQEIIYDAPEYYTTKVEVLINSVWVDVTDEVETGAWTREEFCDGVISEWRVLDNEENVVGSGIFNVECGGEEVTKTPCEWLQEHQTAIEQLQNKKCTIVKEICCDYTVEDIELCEKSCLEITFPDVESLNFSTPPPLSPTGFFAISIGNEEDDVSNGVSYIGVEGSLLLSEIFDNINNISSQYATFVFDGNKLTVSNTDCYYDTIVFAYGITTGTIDPPFDSFIVQSCNEQELEQVFNPLTGALIGYIMRLRKYRFEVLINGVWTDLTDDVVNRTWQRSSCNDTITQWRTIFPSGNDVGYIIIETGNVQSVCTPIIETGTPCELLQDLQDEINALEVAVEELQNNPSTNPTLQSVTDEGNTTDNNIQFGAGAGVFFDNGSRVTEGTTNAGNGGNGGVAMRCSVDYELKWEAGRLYAMEQDGFSIREVSHNFNITPTVNDDDTLGYFVGSRWILDDGTVYVCSDASTGAAVWALAPSQVNADWNATSGVAEILNKPSIPAAQIQSDWNQSNNAALDFIKNKPSIPTAVSQLSNDSGYQTASQVTSAIDNAKPIRVVGIDATANSLTGSVTNGVVASVLIPANTMTTNTIVEFEAFISRASPSAVANQRIYINTANNTTGAQQLAFLQGASANQMLKMERSFLVTSTGLTIYPVGATANIDDNVANASPTNVTVDWTVNQWIIQTADNAVGQTTTNIFLYVKKAQP